MQRLIIVLCLFTSINLYGQVDDAPVAGVSDTRTDVYGFRNARIVTDWHSEINNADILVSKGRIEAVGQNLSFPKGTIIIDLSGKTVYPAFIDIYAGNYGIKTQQDQQDANPFAAFMGGRQGQQAAEPRVANYWNDGIRSSYDAATQFIADQKTTEEYRQAGFGSVVTFKAEGIARGTSVLVSTGDGKANSLLIKSRASANYSFRRTRSADLYPASQFGIIALLRQLNYDAQWYRQLPPGYFQDGGLEAYNSNLVLPQIFEAESKLEVMRADRIGKEFGISYIVKGSGDEYQAINEIKRSGNRLIIPVNFPEAPDVKDPYDASEVSYITLKNYDMAPSNLSMLSRAGIIFAITASDLKQRSAFLTNLRKAVKQGLPEAEALKALTATPAEMIGASALIGSIRKNMIASFLITSGNIFSDDCVIYENWVQGVPYRFVDLRTKDLRGTYSLTADTAGFKLVLTGTFNKPEIRLLHDTTEIKGATFSAEKDIVSISFEREKVKYRLSGYVSGKDLEGKGQLDNGAWFSWKAAYEGEASGEKQHKKPSPPVSGPGPMIYPFSAYGRTELPVQEDVLFRNATVWTSEDEGILYGCDVLVKKGRIAGIGKNLPDQGARVIDASGMHLTPGIIDEHSHIALDATNEVGQAITSEVRCRDVINPEDLSIYRQLAGGVTTSHILHGSANPIGGQSVIIKHRWGLPADDLVIDNQPLFLKHALGENVKRNLNRYPNSRTGVEQIIRDAYMRAADYQTKWKEWNMLKPADRAGKVPPRRDLELDALVDVLEKRSFIVCHAYVQSEITMIMSLAEEFGIKVNTLIHCAEGYKVADQIMAHGAAASVFSDWWDYKFEVYEGNTYNAATLIKQGVLTCLNSDDDEMGRRLNQEAAKVIKYGGISEADAMKLITINPARILHLEERIGSIRAGKEADLVLWTDNPLSVYARAGKVMIDGVFYYDEVADSLLNKQVDGDRNRIISNILKEPSSPSTSNPKFPGR